MGVLRKRHVPHAHVEGFVRRPKADSSAKHRCNPGGKPGLRNDSVTVPVLANPAVLACNAEFIADFAGTNLCLCC